MNSGDHKIRVLVADDSATTLASVCRYLRSKGLFEIVGTARDGWQLLDEAQRLSPELVLTDLSMPRKNGLEAAAELRKLFPDLRILIFTQLSGLSLREECLRHGADGLIEKGQMPERLLEEVRRLFPKSRLPE